VRLSRTNRTIFLLLTCICSLETDAELAATPALWTLTLPQRRRLVAVWLHGYREEFERKYLEQLKSYQEADENVRQINSQAKLDILRKAEIVGVTTTGCAINLELIRQAKPSIVVVEEAAEILEPQLLACLTASVKQLVLIGDHKQLPPSVENYDLSRLNHFDISLLERLIKLNVPHVTLTVQRRMHPDIAQLTKPIYLPTIIQNDPSVMLRSLPSKVECKVAARGDISGIEHRLFLWNHSAAESTTESRSISNPYESEQCSICRMRSLTSPQLAPRWR
jgi:hypothetical protein